MIESKRWWLVRMRMTDTLGIRWRTGAFVTARGMAKAEAKGLRQLRVVLDRNGLQDHVLGGIVSVEMMPRPGRGFDRW